MVSGVVILATVLTQILILVFLEIGDYFSHHLISIVLGLFFLIICCLAADSAL